ncbi:hypothetical protein [Paenibacillus sp. FSL H3-0286]|uniref:hypothetical protein n=1 Tax=Paenibacillus sp. FSL H3-0286 TaxID=2921427 RepID=UPI003250D421
MARTYNYYDFRDAKVNIAHTLMAKGWEVFGYSADKSDSMTDYYCPAHWSGIASKNGYVLLVDVSSLHDSGRKLINRTFNSTTKDIQNKITKLQNMTIDKGASQQEEESAKAAIEKLLEKQNEGWIEEVVGTYPEFKNVNPSTAKWHIEKDGVLVDKGTGIGKFSELPYMWDGANNTWIKGSGTLGNGNKKEVSEEKQRVINAFNKFISRIEKNVSTITVTDGTEVGSADVETMQLITEQVTKTVTRPVKVEKNSIEEGDYLRLAHRGGFWLVTKIYEVNGKNRISYENVGSEKRGYQQLKNAKRFYDLEERMLKAVLEGKTIIHQMTTFDEVTEVEKWVKVGKAPRAKKEVVSVEVEEVVTANEEKAVTEAVEASNVVTMVINKEKNGIELSFDKKPSATIIESLKENGFRWSSFSSKWWAKQTPERLAFAQSFIVPSQSINDKYKTNKENVYEAVTEGRTNSQNDNVICYEFNQAEGVTEEQKEEGDTMENTNTVNENENTVSDSFDDIFNKFDNINITADQKVSGEDLEFCKEQEYIYKELISNYNKFYESLQIIGEKDKEHGKKYGDQSGTYFHTQNTAYYYSMSKYDFQDAINKIKNAFVVCVCGYFEGKYNITIDREMIISKYKEIVTCENIVDEIHEQMGGYNFTEKAEQEIKAKAVNIFKYNDERISIRNNKLILNGYFVRHDSIWKEYRLTNNKEFIFSALSHFDSGSVKINKELSENYCGYDNEKKTSNFEKYETQSFNKVKSIKFLKNGKMEIEFLNNQVATKFANEYCGYNQKSA